MKYQNIELSIKTFRGQIEKGNVYTYEKHFNPEDIEIRKCSRM